MKKLNYGHFLLRRIIPWILCAAILATGINIFYFHTEKIEQISYKNMSFADIRERVIEIMEITHKNDRDSMYRALNHALAFGGSSPPTSSTLNAYIIKDRTTGEIIATSEYKPYLITALHEPPIYYSTETDAHFCGSEGFLHLLQEYQGQSVMIEIIDAYIKDGLFFPGETIVYETDEENGFGDVLFKENFAPENPEDYEHTTNFYWQDLGTKDETILSNLINGATKTEENFLLERNDYINTTAGSFYLTARFNYDFLKDKGTDTVNIFLTSVLSAVIIALITSALAYSKYKKHYEMNEYRRNMTTALAHDLKTPLTAIYGYAENLKNNIRTEKKDYYADAVLQNIQYMNGIITDTLELAKLENSENKIKAEKVNLAEISKELFKKYLPQTEERNISLTINGQAEISGDKALLSQAIENLISNAVKYTADNGKIIISADEKRFSVSNDIDEKIRKINLSEPFQKADLSRGNSNGCGIGLSIVNNIASLHKFHFETKIEKGIFTAEIKF